jgi:DNA polymerase-3 subunit epsilon
MRQIVLDTETTGLDPSQGHRIIEIGCVELNNRRLTGNNYHVYIQPDREIDEGAQQVHGISNEFLQDKPRFNDIVHDLVEYLKGAELVIHNAPFDVGFLNHELVRAGESWGKIETYCSVTDTLVMARKMRPGQKNNLDALCRHYEVNNAQRELHGALLDAELLAEVYLHMTGGQTQIDLGEAQPGGAKGGKKRARKLAENRTALRIVHASAEELKAHDEILQKMGEACRWPL